MTIFTVRVARKNSANSEKSIVCAAARVSGSISPASIQPIRAGRVLTPGL
ncbi:hypothetical protein [Paroceanicella profunda]|nr:hypothetical protein [Paroceanicella profunda]